MHFKMKAEQFLSFTQFMMHNWAETYKRMSVSWKEPRKRGWNWDWTGVIFPYCRSSWPKGPTTSVIWKLFGFSKNDEQINTMYKLCHRLVNAKMEKRKAWKLCASNRKVSSHHLWLPPHMKSIHNEAKRLQQKFHILLQKIWFTCTGVLGFRLLCGSLFLFYVAVIIILDSIN